MKPDTVGAWSFIVLPFSVELVFGMKKPGKSQGNYQRG
jgi:hypothetical protein